MFVCVCVCVCVYAHAYIHVHTHAYIWQLGAKVNALEEDTEVWAKTAKVVAYVFFTIQDVFFTIRGRHGSVGKDGKGSCICLYEYV